MSHIYTLSKGQLQQLISVCDRFKYNMHIELAGVVIKFFKFKELELDGKRRILHFKGPCDFPVRGKFMNYPIGLQYHLSLSIGCFKPVTAVLLIFEFQDSRSHPLLNNVWLGIRFKK